MKRKRNSALMPPEVREIYRRAWDGEEQKDLAVEFCVSRQLVSQIVNGKAHASITGHRDDAPAYREWKAARHDAEVVRLYTVEKWTPFKIAVELELDTHTVYSKLDKAGVRRATTKAAKVPTSDK